jgi:hypothetical protein
MDVPPSPGSVMAFYWRKLGGENVSFRTFSRFHPVLKAAHFLARVLFFSFNSGRRQRFAYGFKRHMRHLRQAQQRDRSSSEAGVRGRGGYAPRRSTPHEQILAHLLMDVFLLLGELGVPVKWGLSRRLRWQG